MAKPKQPDSSSSPSPAARRFPVVGVGASAGGLESLRRMLEAMPEDPQFALVIVHHLARDKPSLAPELLAKFTQMPVAQVEDGMWVRPGHVYVIPPGKYLGIEGGRLRLTQIQGPRRAPVTIDFFLRALATDQGECAVGVILSGTGSDGTLGVKAIKQSGGLVLAQDASTADHSGMPESAIGTHIVDQVLAPEAMPAVLIQFAAHEYISGTPSLHRSAAAEGEAEAANPCRPLGSELTASSREPPPGAVDDTLASIISLLQTRGRRDFSNYKVATLSRRTRRRMCLHRIESYDDYLKFLESHPEEIDLLSKDLLISVTDFFRDRVVWDELAADAIPKLVASKADDSMVRVWVAGCATGEEAYTIAMLLLEEIGKQRKPCGVQVFASDIDADALDVARAGIYPVSIEADVSPERLQRFFTLRNGDLHYGVNKSLRETVVFANQNLISDPPFSRLDLICCRNVLIYLKPELQQRLIALFHFALYRSGFLLLGTAETIGRHDELFETVDKRRRIYQSRGPRRHDRLMLPSALLERRREIETPARFQPLQRPADLAKQKLLELLAARAVLIDRDWRIHYISGDVNAYLMYQEGVPDNDLLRKLDPSLRSQARAAVHQAYANHSDASVICRADRGPGKHQVRIDVRLITGNGDRDDLALLVFTEVPPATSLGVEASDDATIAAHPAAAHLAPPLQIDDSALIHQLEEELATTKDDLLSTIEQFEISNEEFKASNEEVMSINEELQSTNEELETSKEELQSLNEELSTVNLQLEGKVEELEVKHADLENLIAATELATICLGADLTIRWFTPATRELIRIQPADVGRPLQDLQNDFLSNDLTQECQQVLQNRAATNREVDCRGGRTFIRRIVPYLADGQRIGGLVITLVEITARRRREQELRESERNLRELTKTLEQQVAQRTELLSILQDVTRLANEARSVEEALRAAMARLAQFSSWQVGHVWRRVEQDAASPTWQDGTARWISTALWHVNDDFARGQSGLAEFQQFTQQMSIDSGEGIIGMVLETGLPQQIADISQSKNTPRAKIPGLNLRGAVAFPVPVDGEIVAIMEFFSTAPAEAKPAFLEIMPDIGIQLGHVVARKRMEQVVAEIASEEQNRIGRELHDGIAQQLTGGALIAQALRRSLSADSISQLQSTDHLIEIFRETHEDVDRLSRGLLPNLIAPAHLLPALADMVVESEQRFGSKITLDSERFERTFVRNEVVATTIYQIAREALHNAIKHSGSKRIELQMATTDSFEMTVRDHGGGFETRHIKPNRNGLRIMRYRAEAIGGELSLQSNLGQGTQLSLTIPKPRCQS